MKLYKIVLKGITQRLLKVVFVYLGITIGVSTIVAVFNVTESMKINMADQTSFSGPDIVITPDYKGITMSYGGITLPEVVYETNILTNEDLKKIEELAQNEYFNVVSPKITGIANNSANQGYVINGINSSEEIKMNPWLFDNSSNDADYSYLLGNENIIVGSKVAQELNIKEQSEIVLNNKTFIVAYVLGQMGDEKDLSIYMSLENAGTILERTNSYSSIGIIINKDTISETRLINEIEQIIPHAKIVSPRRESLLKNDMLVRFTRFGFALSTLVFIAGALMVTITVLGSVREKTREIGIFRALGFRKIQIAKMILFESFVISFLAGISGYFIGYLTTLIASNYFAYMNLVKPLDLVMLVFVVLLSIISGIISSIYPAIKGANLNPVEAMRFI